MWPWQLSINPYKMEIFVKIWDHVGKIYLSVHPYTCDLLSQLIGGTLVKALFHCKLENLKKLIESLLFAEHTMITGQGFQSAKNFF